MQKQEKNHYPNSSFNLFHIVKTYLLIVIFFLIEKQFIKKKSKNN